ncbi:MAG: hypothetical protein K2N63_09990 [Lachnospiraceae bacterium]|nr:hypothetical protein [Lachnospiraceae bacterium]
MKKNRVLTMLLCIILIFSSCASDSAPELVFITEKIILREPDNTFALSKDMELSSVDGLTYAFERAVSSDERMDCIKETQSILDIIGSKNKIHIYVYADSTYNDTYISDGAIYTFVQSWKSPEYISYLLLGLFGEYCNYGAIYGYAAFLYGQLNGATARKNEFVWDNATNCSALDLNLLCFNETFVSPKEVENVRNISVAFVSDYMNVHGISKFHELLINSGTVEGAELFGKALSDFYSANHIDYIPSNVLYAFGGRSYDYIARCPYAAFFITKDWYDENAEQNPLTYENFLHQNYVDVKKFFEVNSEQMRKYQFLFGLEPYNNDLKVYFSNNKRLSRVSYYKPETHSIYLMNVDSLMHEYIHSITVEHNPSDSMWSIEGATRYFSYKYDDYGIAILNADYNAPASSEENLYIREFKEKIGRDIEIEVDFTEIEDIIVYSRGYSDPNSSYAAGSSFVAYMVSQFGEEEVIGMIFSEQGVEHSLYTELVDNWVSYINTNYADYSKYK